MSLGIAILGAGRWGQHLIRNFVAEPRVNIMAIADRDRERLQAIAQKQQLTDSVQLCSDWQAALQVPGVDAVVVATPATSHYEIIQFALQQSLHVLAEKPLTLTASESEALTHLAARRQRCLMVDHTYLFHPAVIAGQAVVQSGALGQLRYGYASRTHLGPVRYDVDAFWDLAIHDLCIFQAWLGRLPLKVQASGQQWLQADLADLVWANLQFPQQLPVHLHLAWLNPDKQRRLVLVGDRGALIFDELAAQPLVLQAGTFEQQSHLFVPVDQHTQVIDVPQA
ncbi:MAG: Gfo/Idh/MocA family oxidoreductase, partial [Cyanobacteria bacterium P01_H01_bin.121]